MMKTEPDHVDTMEAKSFSLNPKQAEMTRSPKLHENLKAFQSTTQKWYILPIGGLYGTYHLLREPRNSIDPVKPSQFWWPWMSRDYMTYQKKTVSKISPTYPWKMPPTFHQQLLKDFFSLFGEVWGIFPGALWAKSVTCLKAPIFCTNTNSMKWFKTEALKSGEFEVARSTM